MGMIKAVQVKVKVQVGESGPWRRTPQGPAARGYNAVALNRAFGPRGR